MRARIRIFSTHAPSCSRIYLPASGRRRPELGATNLGLDLISGPFFLDPNLVRCHLVGDTNLPRHTSPSALSLGERIRAAATSLTSLKKHSPKSFCSPVEIAKIEAGGVYRLQGQRHHIDCRW
jgi:hypothetical protein